MIEPGKSTFYNPAPGEFLPFMRLYFLRNINVQAKLLPNIGYKSTTIAGIPAESLNRRIVLFRSLCRKNSRLCIMDIRSMDNNGQYVPKHIYNDVSFPPFCFFPPSIPLSSLAATVFTLWESMTA